MKILQVHNYYSSGPGGEETVLETERELLQSKGHTVDQFVVSNDEVASQFLTAGLQTIWSRDSYSGMQESIRKAKPDLVHVHNTFVRLSPSVYWAAAAEAIPVVQTLHNYRLTCSNGLLMRNGKPCEQCVDKPLPLPALHHKCYRGSLPATGAVAGMQVVHKALRSYMRKVNAYIAPTDFARRIMVRAGLPKERVYVKPNFVTDSLEGRVPLTEKKDQVVFVGRVTHEKGVDLLLKAWRRLKPSSTKLVIIGDGSERDRLMRQFWNLQDVEWQGHSKREKVLQEVALSRYLVMPSRCYETFGLAILEALELGTPVIAPNHGGFPDIVCHENDGLLFTPNEERSLSAVLRHALQIDETYWQRLSENARNTYLKRFTPEANYPLLMEIYEQSTQRVRSK